MNAQQNNLKIMNACSVPTEDALALVAASPDRISHCSKSADLFLISHGKKKSVVILTPGCTSVVIPEDFFALLR